MGLGGATGQGAEPPAQRSAPPRCGRQTLRPAYSTGDGLPSALCGRMAPAVEALDEGVLCRLAVRNVVSLDPHLLAPAQCGHAVNSVPLSETHVAGRPRCAMTAVPGCTAPRF
jgi:hypothetical protein